MAAAKKSVGFKRICLGCGTRFYDFGKRPIICPTCQTEFSGEYKVRGGRKGRVAAEAKLQEEEVVKKPQIEAGEEEGLDEDEELEVVSLEDVEEDDGEEDDDKAADLADDDLDGLPEFDEDLDEDLEEDEEEVLDEDED